MDIRESLLNVDTWIRLLFIALFWVLLTLAGWIWGAIVVVQFLVVLVTGERNMQLVGFAQSLGTYIKQIVDYTCFVDDEKPFPFADFPDND